MIDKVLIANRGEIALRIIRACRELGIQTLAVYSDADREALHVQAADEAVHIGPTSASQSYLNAARIIDTAREYSCAAIHPGYGFLAENALFARACTDAGLTFIGPSPGPMELMGGKLAARAHATAAGVPVVPGTLEPVTTADEVKALAQRFGYPVAIKASAGGGGKGLKVAMSAAEVEQAVSLAAKEAQAYFADPTLYVERYLAHPRHIEIQILGDRHGNVVHLGERDCSLQRRHQKLVEETPSRISDRLRSRMCEAAVRLAQSIGYDSAGTIECLVEGDEFFFLEMNARIQVEHTISEAVYGFDLVKAQIRIAGGERLWRTQEELVPRGHAIECRINAESPAAGFAPAPGRIARYIEPGGPGIRIDSAAYAGWTIGSDYDSLIGKLIAWGSDRDEARRRMLRALDEYQIEGVPTTAPFLRLLLDDPAFVDATYSTASVEDFMRRRQSEIENVYDAAAARPQVSGVTASTEDTAASDAADLAVEVNEKLFRVRVFGLPAGTAGPSRRAPSFRSSKPVAFGGPSIAAPMHGIVAEIKVQPGDNVRDGQVVAVIEAM
ncbi:MAG: acetyl-CoA carboxylase biotin carboxylase subunit, partial [Candidatus Eremiobacteraeota bacterium]|nr:acetyl-CoA carboxylase biotin carboxylase subunit [Candidatus Eremiobacteraeota bacterium]